MRSILFATAALLAAGCGSPIPCKNKAAPPTWTANTQQIYVDHCDKCHSLTPTVTKQETGDVPDSAFYDNFSNAARYAVLAGQRVENKSMPPARENDPLSAADVETIQQWAACGATK